MFLKECKSIAKSIIYFAFLLVTLMFYVTQLGNYAGNDIEQYQTLEENAFDGLSDNPLVAPVPGMDNYGYKRAEIPEQVMPNAIIRILQEYGMNKFSCYSTGLYRGVKLSQSQLDEISSILKEMTGLSYTELQERLVNKSQSDGPTVVFGGVQPMERSSVIPVIVDYNQFKEMISHIDKMIGGKSSYASENLKQFGQVPVTYEEKLEEYHNFLNEDKITGAYARLFCDYMGIVIALFSVFVPVSFLLRDRSAKMNELIYSRRLSSVKLVIIRYLALVFMTIIPFILLSVIPTVQLAVFGFQNNLPIDVFAFLKYMIGWLLPTVLTTTAVAYFLTILTDTPSAILVQFLWSYSGISSITDLDGGRYGFAIAVRHNTLGNLQAVKENMNELLINRLSYTAIALLLIAITVFLYHLKRRGKLDVFGALKTILGNRKSPV